MPILIVPIATARPGKPGAWMQNAVAAQLDAPKRVTSQYAAGLSFSCAARHVWTKILA
jgi:hypothetical protein